MEPLSYEHYYKGAAASIGNYGIILTGNGPNAYDYRTLTKVSIAWDVISDDGGSGTSNSSYAVFSGCPLSLWHWFSVYNASLTLSSVSLTNRSYGIRFQGAAGIGNYALFFGGLVSSGYTSAVWNVNSSLVAGWNDNLNNSTSGCSGGSIGSYAICLEAGRLAWSFDGSLNKRALTNVTNYDNYRPSAKVGSYLIFASCTNNYGNAGFDHYNTSLTKGTITTTSRFYNGAGGSVGTYGIFAGLRANGNDPSKTTEAYNASLVKTACPDLGEAKSGMKCISNGTYAIFGGGTTDKSDRTVTKSVDAYTNGLEVIHSA